MTHITLKEKYESKKYKFKVAGVYDYAGSLSIFMPIQELNKIFDMDKDAASADISLILKLRILMKNISVPPLMLRI